MNTARSMVPVALAALVITASSLLAAPCPSIESACASTAYQKVDALLGQKIVTDRLETIGVSPAQARARVSQLTEEQLQQLAAQADMIQAGGTIQGGDVNRLGPLDYLWRQVCMFCLNVYHFVFTWDPSQRPY
ncbi:MAG TPA: PA2779 family protein [Verrucomicrobiae bacterium]|nr:PA2779 family protein [Verrucomicrobiae bacterium]